MTRSTGDFFVGAGGRPGETYPPDGFWRPCPGSWSRIEEERTSDDVHTCDVKGGAVWIREASGWHYPPADGEQETLGPRRAACGDLHSALCGDVSGRRSGSECVRVERTERRVND